MAFQDHFSARSADYAKFRPAYPTALFAWLREQCPHRAQAWDCGTGNGQAALALAEDFLAVQATDPSAAQLANAPRHERITYREAVEGDSGLPDDSTDLVTAAQAFHWFDVPRFFEEASRVLRPGGLVATWCYGLHRVSPEVDAIFDVFYHERVGRWWPAERRHVESGYRTLPFPAAEVVPPALAISASLDLHRLLSYVATWSAVGRCREATGVDPIGELRQTLAPVWGDPARPLPVRWPIAMRAGRFGGKT